MPNPRSGPFALTRQSEECRSAHLLALEVMREIRTPLEVLSNLTFLTFEEASEAEKVRLYMRLAEEQVATLTRLAGHTLALVSYTSSSEATDLVQLADSAINMHAKISDAKKIHLVRDAPARLTAHLSGPNILLAISSLIVNALDALPEEGTLSIRLRRRKDGIHLLVADNGHGIMPEHARKIYDPFFTTRKETGRGLGLSFTQKIIEDHNGQIRFRSSVRVGQSGTAFKMFLPQEGG